MKARVRFAWETNAPAEDSAPTVHGDPYQIQQVFMNVILNAIQASNAGGEIRIRTQVSETGAGQKYVCIEIEDDGKGMNEEETAKAFQPFFSSKAEGTGLGLPIAKQIVERHQGRISIRSKPGKGTCVRAEFPLYLRQPDVGS